MFNQALTLSAALLLWASSVGAQQSANRMMHAGGMGQDTMHMMRGDMGMMSSSAPGPALLIRMGQILDLTEKQITDLEAIQDEFTDQRASHMPLAMEAHEQAAELIAGGEADLGVYEDILRETMDHMISLHVSLARAALDANAVLTAEQRLRLEGAVAMMRHMESMRDEGMSDRRSDTARHEHGASSGA